MTTKNAVIDLDGIKFCLIGRHMNIINNEFGSVYSDENIEAAIKKMDPFNGYTLVVEKNVENGTTSLKLEKAA